MAKGEAVLVPFRLPTKNSLSLLFCPKPERHGLELAAAGFTPAVVMGRNLNPSSQWLPSSRSSATADESTDMEVAAKSRKAKPAVKYSKNQKHAGHFFIVIHCNSAIIIFAIIVFRLKVMCRNVWHPSPDLQRSCKSPSLRLRWTWPQGERGRC